MPRQQAIVTLVIGKDSLLVVLFRYVVWIILVILLRQCSARPIKYNVAATGNNDFGYFGGGYRTTNTAADIITIV